MGARSEIKQGVHWNRKLRNTAFFIVGYCVLFLIVWAEKGISPALVAVPFLMAFQLNTFFVFNIREVTAGVLTLEKTQFAFFLAALIVNGYVCYRIWDNLIFYSILWVIPLLLFLGATLFLSLMKRH